MQKKRNDSRRGRGKQTKVRRGDTRQRRRGAAERRTPMRGGSGGSRGGDAGRPEGRSGGEGAHGAGGVRAGTHRPRTSPAWWGSSGPCRPAGGAGRGRAASPRRGRAQRGRSPAAAPPQCRGPAGPGRSAMLRNFPAAAQLSSPTPPRRAEEKEGGREGRTEGRRRLVPAPAGITCSRPGPPRSPGERALRCERGTGGNGDKR